jgi:hypothetical protein
LAHPELSSRKYSNSASYDHGRANAIQASGAQQLHTMFAGTTLADYQHNQQTWQAKLEAFWKANRQPTNDGHVDKTVAIQRLT